MLGFMILKIMTTLVLTVLAISGVWYAPKQKTASEGVTFFALAMFLAFGITFMWVQPMWLPEIMRITPYHNVEWVKFIKPLLLPNICCCVGIGYVAEKSRHQECMKPVCGKRKWNNAFDNTKFYKVPYTGVTIFQIKQYRVFHENNPGADGLSPGVQDYRQAVRHSTLTAAFPGPNPGSPVSQMFSSFGLCNLRIFHLHGRLLSPHSGMLLRAVARLVRV